MFLGMHTRKIYLFIAFYIALVLAMGYAARNLRFDGSLESLLPHNNPHVLAFEQLKQLRSSEGGIEAVLKIKDDSLASMAEMSSSVSAFRGTSRDSLIQQLLGVRQQSPTPLHHCHRQPGVHAPKGANHAQGPHHCHQCFSFDTQGSVNLLTVRARVLQARDRPKFHQVAPHARATR